jgi:hypothetical protein
MLRQPWKRAEKRAHRGGAYGGRRSSGSGWACARSGRGLVYILAGGRLGASGLILMIGARAVWAAMPGGQWCAAGSAPTSVASPLGAPQRPWTSHTGAHRRSIVTSRHSGPSVCTPDAGTTRTAACRRGRARRCGRARSGVPRRFPFVEPVFKRDFL